MGAIPFTLYDFFAYLSTGALWLLGIDYAFNLKLILGQKPDAGQTVVWIIVSYVLGHINSHWAAWLLEGRIVARVLGYPSATLFTKKGPKPSKVTAVVKDALFAHYLTPLPEETATAILNRYEKLSGARQPGDPMFNHCFAIVKERLPVAQGSPPELPGDIRVRKEHELRCSSIGWTLHLRGDQSRRAALPSPGARVSRRCRCAVLPLPEVLQSVLDRGIYVAPYVEGLITTWQTSAQHNPHQKAR